MTPRSLFNIILKILGIFFIRDILYQIPQIFVFIQAITRPDSMPAAIWNLVTVILVLIVEIITCYSLVFKTEWIIGVLKLEKGFDQETIPLNMHRSTILRISIIVIGGLLIVNEVPTFFTQLFIYVQEKRAGLAPFNPEIKYTLIAGFKILVGALLIAEQRLLVNLIERQQKKKPVE
jgi:hypothetical protein